MELHDKLVTTCLKVRSRSALVLALVALGVTVGCISGGAESAAYGPPPECDAGPTLCPGTTTGMGVGSSGGQGGGDAGGQGVTVVGTLQRLNEPSFTTVQTFLDAATVFVVDSDATAEYNGLTSNTFTLMNVDPGTRWFFVRDNTAGSSGIFSTYSAQAVPSASTIALAVIDSLNLTTIANSLQETLNPGKAHIILKFSNNGLPLSGVNLTTVFPGTIAYDTGCGIYSSLETVTGACGIILILNFSATADDEYQMATVTHPTLGAKTAAFYTRPDSATIVAFSYN